MSLKSKWGGQGAIKRHCKLEDLFEKNDIELSDLSWFFQTNEPELTLSFHSENSNFYASNNFLYEFLFC